MVDSEVKLEMCRVSKGICGLDSENLPGGYGSLQPTILNALISSFFKIMHLCEWSNQILAKLNLPSYFLILSLLLEWFTW